MRTALPFFVRKVDRQQAGRLAMAQVRAAGDGEALLQHGHGHGHGGESNKKARAGLRGVLREHKVVELARGKRRLVEVPYTATLAHAANALLARRVSAVTVAAPPGHWIGAGGSMILESDPATGAARKQYIGMVNMLDILTHIAEAGDDAAAVEEGQTQCAQGEATVDLDLDRRMAVPVSSIIGHSLESLTLWTLHPNTSVLDCMETFSKGVHRALVPLESSAENVVALELVESAPVYKMLTQMDVIRFLRAHSADLSGVLSRTVRELGAMSESVLAVASGTTVIEAIKAMRAATLTAVPVVENDDDGDAQILQDGRGKKLVETFSATDLRDCPVAQVRSWLGTSVTEFKKKVAEHRREGSRPAIDATSGGQQATNDGGGEDYTDADTDTDTAVDAALSSNKEEEEKPAAQPEEEMVTCSPESSLGEAIEKAVANHVHRVWAVDEGGLLRGVVSLTDVLRVVREAALAEDRDLHGIVV